MNLVLRIVPLLDLPSGIEDLRAEAVVEGFRFVDRLIFEWQSGCNRFLQRGEVFVGAFWEAELVAVGGLNRDPYADQDGIGRLRHLYVRRSARHTGAGSAIVRHLLDKAEGAFHSVRLRTETQEAADFYVGLGFQPVHDKTATHVRVLRDA